ncbi:MAG TPA: NrsF family protein [Polyangiaceae bacterium]|nr:NrsF family protein [Polyangiaceae bacterium]
MSKRNRSACVLREIEALAAAEAAAVIVPAAPPAELASRVRAAVVQSPAPRSTVRKRVTFALVAIPAAILAGLLGSQVAFPGRSLLRIDFSALPEGAFAERFLVLLLLAGVATGIALFPGRRGLGSKVGLLAIAAVLATPLYTLATNVAPLGTALGDATARVLHPLGLPCALVAFAVGVILLAAFGLALRRAVPAATVNRAAALGAAAGAWAGVALFLQCPAKTTLHLLVGHSLPVATFAVLGAVVLPRLLRP